MARLARVVVAGVAHHMTERGNRRQQTFFRLEPLEGQEEALWRRDERTGRPLGSPAFLDRVEKLMGQPARPAKPGRKPKCMEK